MGPQMDVRSITIDGDHDDIRRGGTLENSESLNPDEVRNPDVDLCNGADPARSDGSNVSAHGLYVEAVFPDQATDLVEDRLRAARGSRPGRVAAIG
jgi:hypothetical protein